MDFDALTFDTAITNLGNLAVVGPAAVIIWLWLLQRRGVWAAIRFQWPILVTFCMIVCLKEVSRSIGGGLEGTPFELSTGAPSGHIGMATVVYGGVALMLLRRGVEPIGLLAAVLAVMALIGIAVTRVILHAHTPADVAVGFVIGGACAIWASRGSEVPLQEPVRYVAELVLLVIGAVTVMHVSGFRFDSAAVM
jgi:membrane-associated phospholipid phosphatase